MLRSMLEAHGLDIEHPEDAMAEAHRWVEHPGIDSPELRDLTHLPFVTIDETTSRDLDQALTIAPEGDGHIVYYAIADASYYIRPGSALYREALRRGASYYLPGLVIPMLPAILSEDLISLNPGVDRRALVWVTHLDAQGEPRGLDVCRARIHSQAKLSWGEVQNFYEGGPCPREGLAETLQALKIVGQRRIALAESRHVLRFRRREVSVRLDSGERRFIAESDDRLDVERYNEQISLLTNEQGARFLEQDHPDPHPIYRVHEPPSAERLAKFRTRADAILASHQMADWRWDPQQESLATWLRRLPQEGAAGRVAQAIHRAAMRSGGRAVFREQAGQHHGVGADVYGRFTAPMREIVGIFLHEETVEKLRGAPFTEIQGWRDGPLRDQIMRASESARKRQRELDQASNRLVLDQLFAADLAIRRERAGTVMDIVRGKAFVQLDDPSIEIKVYRTHLEEAWGERLEADGVVFRGRRSQRVRLRIGQAVRVTVAGRDGALDRWKLALGTG